MACRTTWARVDTIVSVADLDDLCLRPEAEGDVDLRSVLAHLLEETARRSGHADVIRELVDTTTGR